MIVRYCPGSSSGSPAWMSPAEAQSQLARDYAVLEKLEKVDSLSVPCYWPHVGGKCGKCSFDQPVYPGRAK